MYTKKSNIQRKKYKESSTRHLGDILQKYLRKRFSLKETSNSGATRGDGDEIGKLFAIEAKATTKNSIAISKDTWHKIVKESQAQGLYPLYILGYINSIDEIDSCLCVTTLDYLTHVLNPGAFVEDDIVNVIKQVLSQNNINQSIIDDIEETILEIWQDKNHTL